MPKRIRAAHKRATTPSNIKNKVGEMISAKGTIAGDYIEGTKNIFSWDAVPSCIEMDCPAYDECSFVASSSDKCKAIMQYMKGVQDLMFHNFAEVVDEPTLFRIGMHLSPLYIILAKLKITELGQRQVIITNPKTGMPAIHPLYKEIRETIRMIENTWRSIGIDPKGGLPIPNEIPVGTTMEAEL